MGVCNCSMFCCTLLYVHSSFAIILMGKRELIALLNLSYWCLIRVGRLFLAVPRGCLQFVIVLFPDHTHLLFLSKEKQGVAIALSLLEEDRNKIQEKVFNQIGLDQLKRDDGLDVLIQFLENLFEFEEF